MSKKRRNKSQRRKLRREKVKNRRKKLLKQNSLFSKKDLQKPWEAVKMQMFNVPNPFPPDFPVEKRIEIFKQIALSAQSTFDEKYKKLGKWFEKHDALYLLSFCLHYFLSHEEGVDPEATGAMEFYPHYQEWLQAFALTQNRSYKLEPLNVGAYELFEEMKEIGTAVTMRWAGEIPETEELREKFRLSLEQQSLTTAVRNWAYFHQMKRVSLEMATLIDEDFSKVYGIKASAVIELLFTIIDKKTDELNEHRRKLYNCVRQKNFKEMIRAYNDIFPGMKPISDLEAEKMWDLSGKNKKSLGAMLLSHSDLWLEKMYSFDTKFLKECLPARNLTEEKIQIVFDLISIEFGELSDWDVEHFILGNPVKTRPFINLGSGNYFTGVIGIIPDSALDILESLIWKNDELRSNYNRKKAVYLENKVSSMLTKHFPSAQIYCGSLYDDKYENDILMVIDSFAIVIEAKSRKISDSGYRGAPGRLRSELKELIEEPSIQALRFINHLQKNKKIITFETKSGKINTVDTSKINYFIPLGVTFANLSTISGNLKKLIRANITDKKLEELAPSISFTDLEIILEMLETEPQRIHYLARRREFEAHVEYEGDEMDLLAFYLDTGFNIGEDEYNIENVFNLSLKSKELDPYIVGTNEGRKIVKPSLQMTQWWSDVIDFASRKKSPSWIESCFILFNFDYAEQKEFERQLTNLKKKIKSGNTEKPHNWGVFVSGPERRRYAVAVYPFITDDKEVRNSIMEQIFVDTEKSHRLRGMLVIGQSLNKLHYPYSVIARKTSTDLFDVLTLQTDNPAPPIGEFSATELGMTANKK